jgi:hypothetical protein
VCHVSLPSSYRSRRCHIHLLRVLPLVGCRSKTPTGLHRPPLRSTEDAIFLFFPFWRAGPDVSDMGTTLELYQTLSRIWDPRWSCSTMELRGSAALELFLQSWSSPKHALSLRLALFFFHGTMLELMIYYIASLISSLPVKGSKWNIILYCFTVSWELARDQIFFPFSFVLVCFLIVPDPPSGRQCFSRLRTRMILFQEQRPTLPVTIYKTSQLHHKLAGSEIQRCSVQ